MRIKAIPSCILVCHCLQSLRFLDAFAKLRKATISFAKSVRPSILSPICMEQLVSQWTDFREIWYLRIFIKSIKKIQASLKSDRNKRMLYTRTNIHLRSYLSQALLEWEMIQTSSGANWNTYFSSIIFFFKTRAVYESIWKNVAEPGKPQLKIWRMRFICCIPTVQKHSEYVTLIALPLQQWLHERASVLRHMYTSCLFMYEKTNDRRYLCEGSFVDFYWTLQVTS
jgi:hypothetical protein